MKVRWLRGAVLGSLVLAVSAWTAVSEMSVRLTADVGEVEFAVISNSPVPLDGVTGRTPVVFPSPPHGVHSVFASLDGETPIEMRLFTGHPEIFSTRYGVHHPSSVQILEIRSDDVSVTRHTPVGLVEAAADIEGPLMAQFADGLVCRESEVIVEALLGDLATAKAICAELRR